MEVADLVKKYLAEAKMMQVATIDGDQPWICTVYFVTDENQNLYWISIPERRHSQEISKHRKVATTIAVTKKLGDPVIGLQLEGDAAEIKDTSVIIKAMRLYTDKFSSGEEFYNDFIAGKNSHKLYCIKPRLIVLFDEKNFPDDSRKEWKPSR